MHYTPGPRTSSPIAAPEELEICVQQRGSLLLTINPSVGVAGAEESSTPANAVQPGLLSAEDALNRATTQPSADRPRQTQARQ